MNTGKALFAQLMDFLPWTMFTRIGDRFEGDRRVRTFLCAERYRVMAFAQIGYRGRLRDIEACLSVYRTSCITWRFGRRLFARAWLMPAGPAIGKSTYAEFSQ